MSNEAKAPMVVRLRQIQTYGNYTEYKSYGQTIDEACALLESRDGLMALLKESRQYLELGASSALRDGRNSDVGAVLNGLVNRIDAALTGAA